jgi:hypothetical protein
MARSLSVRVRYDPTPIEDLLLAMRLYASTRGGSFGAAGWDDVSHIGIWKFLMVESLQLARARNRERRLRVEISPPPQPSLELRWAD